jgi:hypothetical protein
VREVASVARLRSSQTTHYHLWKSKKEDYVVREAGRAKMIWLTEKRGEATGRIDLMGKIAAEDRGRGGGRGLFFGDRASSGPF